MDAENNSYYQTYSGVEVSRKRKGKKRGKQANLTALKIYPDDLRSESDTSNAVESAGDTNLTDENDEEQFDGISTPNRDENFRVGGTVSVDGVMKTPPKIVLTEQEKVIPLETEKLYPSTIGNEKEHSPVTTPTLQEGTEDIQQIFNTRALSKHATTYELEKFEKNALIIFNQENIEGHKPRRGTEKDVESLTNTFGNFGFEVVEHKDLKKDDVFKELKTFSERDYTDYGCVGVAVLTHGSNQGLLRAKDVPYTEIEIINHFKMYNKPTLVTKPKFLIIQACRGTKSMQGVPVLQMGKIRIDLDEDHEPYVLPVEADMLIIHSSYAGNPSHRDELHGSWFIQSLCRKIDQLASSHDLESIITEVKREVAIDKFHEEYNRRTYEMDINKQMPVMTSTLIRKLYLKKFGDKATALLRASPNIIESSRNEVLDNSSPNTPLLVQSGPCSCFLDHFNYIRNCLRFYLEENIEDETAQAFLDLSNTFEEEEKFNAAKERMTKAICMHLTKNARNCQYYKYLYFYKH